MVHAYGASPGSPQGSVGPEVGDEDFQEELGEEGEGGMGEGKGPFPSFFGVSLVFYEALMGKKAGCVACCSVLHSSWKAPA